MTEYTPSKNISTIIFFNLFSLTQWQSYNNKISAYLSIYLSIYLSMLYIYMCVYLCLCVYIYLYNVYICISGQKWSTTHRVLKSHRSKMGVYTSCPQVHELPQTHCGDNQEVILFPSGINLPIFSPLEPCNIKNGQHTQYSGSQMHGTSGIPPPFYILLQAVQNNSRLY